MLNEQIKEPDDHWYDEEIITTKPIVDVSINVNADSAIIWI